MNDHASNYYYILFNNFEPSISRQGVHVSTIELSSLGLIERLFKALAIRLFDQFTI